MSEKSVLKACYILTLSLFPCLPFLLFSLIPSFLLLAFHFFYLLPSSLSLSLSLFVIFRSRLLWLSQSRLFYHFLFYSLSFLFNSYKLLLSLSTVILFPFFTFSLPTLSPSVVFLSSSSMFLSTSTFLYFPPLSLSPSVDVVRHLLSPHLDTMRVEPTKSLTDSEAALRAAEMREGPSGAAQRPQTVEGKMPFYFIFFFTQHHLSSVIFSWEQKMEMAYAQ